MHGRAQHGAASRTGPTDLMQESEEADLSFLFCYNHTAHSRWATRNVFCHVPSVTLLKMFPKAPDFPLSFYRGQTLYQGTNYILCLGTAYYVESWIVTLLWELLWQVLYPTPSPRSPQAIDNLTADLQNLRLSGDLQITPVCIKVLIAVLFCTSLLSNHVDCWGLRAVCLGRSSAGRHNDITAARACWPEFHP